MNKSLDKQVYSSFDQLKPVQLHDLFRLRQQVFILEQNCPYDDIDGHDPEAMHYLIYRNNMLAAYSRIFQPGSKYADQCSIGRIIVHPEFRSTGLGHELIRGSIERCECDLIRIEAQAPLISYYNQFGFKEEGEVYVVDGIDHIQMVLDRSA
ncbi:GNAT family N-acetyltransferase [Balneola sp. MJW-20]|uniref:GNAT family N-acetyltransferase n=1 Tax=Gracilimonas aurantiaca TaxID=3234185 RepID=UPI003465DC53